MPIYYFPVASSRQEALKLVVLNHMNREHIIEVFQSVIMTCTLCLLAALFKVTHNNAIQSNLVLMTFHAA